MCGIAAIFAYQPDAPPVDRQELRAIRDHMAARGPDGLGEWYAADHRVGMAHRRLSIIDLSEAGAQPMTDPATGNVIVFNGEIYNYRELRRDLEAKGYRFRSSCDTEVLLHLYAAKGPEMVQDLRGMYAFAIYAPGLPSIPASNSFLPAELSEAKRRLREGGRRPGEGFHSPGLFLARDPFGIKPLYIHDDGKTIRLASQVKALLAGGNIPKEIEPAGHAGFFLWGHVPEPFTLYKNITAFAPGATLWLDGQGKRVTTQFCGLREEFARTSQANPHCRPDEAQQVLRHALVDTVRAHLVADVPVGIFLSSGLDSTTLVALASEVGADLRTVTLGFEEYRGTEDDEVPLAEEVARQYGARHQTVWVTKDEFRSHHDALLQAMDQPTIDGVNTYFVSLAARQAGLKVALSGLGGDELLGGYPSFSQIPKSVRALSWANSIAGFGRLARRLAAPLISRWSSPKYASLLEYGGSYGGAYLLRRALYMPWELSQVMDEGLATVGLRDLRTEQCLQQTLDGIKGGHHKISALETTWYMRNQLLRDTDWASMAHSLEIRVPLVDLALMRAVAPLVYNFGPSPKKAMAFAPRHSLPKAILSRPKSGFSVPTREWLLPPGSSKGAGSRQWAWEVFKEFL